MLRSLAFAVLGLCICANPAPAQMPADSLPKPLKDAGIDPSMEGVRDYLKALTEGKHAPLSDREVRALIADLGHRQFKVREAASKRLAELHLPPLDRLNEAARSSDPEIARRAASILDQIATRPDIPALVCRHIVLVRMAVSPEQLLKVIAVLERPAAEEAAQDAFAAVTGAKDRDLITKALADANPRVKAAGVRMLAVLHKDPDPELEKHLKEKEPRVRLAAARALIERTTNFDISAYAKVLDDEGLLVLLRIAERRFRHLNEKKCLDPQVNSDYDRLIEQYVAALVKVKAAEQAKKPPSGDHHWLNQAHDTSKHPEVLAYRIRWFAGQWSCWYVPGFNDCEVGKGRDARLWGCFADHEHEVVTTRKKEFFREIHDLKTGK